jgi:hypothetical protein
MSRYFKSALDIIDLEMTRLPLFVNILKTNSLSPPYIYRAILRISSTDLVSG